MIPLERVQRALGSLPQIGAHDIASGLELLAAALLERALDEEAMVVHRAVTDLRAITTRRLVDIRQGATRA